MAYVIKGALSAFIERGENFKATAVVAQVGDDPPWCFLPFDRVPVTDLIAIDERLLLVVAQSGEQPTYQMGVFDVVERRRLGKVADRRLIAGRLRVDRAGTRVTHVCPGLFKAWRLPDLAELWTSSLPSINLVGVAERGDGALVIKGGDVYEYASDHVPPLVLVIGPDGRQLEAHGQAVGLEGKRHVDDKRPVLELSACGRWLWRAHLDTVLATTADGAPLDPAALKGAPDSEIATLLDAIRIHGVQEIWPAGPIENPRRIPVRSVALRDLLGYPPQADDDADGDPAQRALRAHRLKTGRKVLGWLARLLEHAPYDQWRPGDRAPSLDALSEDLAIGRQVWLAIRAKAHGEIVDWDEPSGTFTVKFGDEQRRVGVDGQVGAFEPAPPEPWAPTPAPLKALVAAFLRRESIPIFDLPTLDEPDCIRAIDAVSARMAAGIDSVVWGERLILNFRTPDRDVSEKEFFAHVGETCPGAVGALRRLLAAYDEAARVSDVWADDETAALGYAALALARLDPEAHRYLEGYFRRRDPSHEPFGTASLLPTLAATTRDFGDVDALRFALRRLPDEELVGQGHLLAPAILRGARAACSPTAFAREVEREGQDMMRRANVEYSSLWNDRFWFQRMTQMVRFEEESVENGLIAPLIEAADRRLAWDRDFLAVVDRKTVRFRHRPDRWFDAWRQVEIERADLRTRYPPGPARPRMTLSSVIFAVFRLLSPVVDNRSRSR
jgi:hypothetical protein